MDTLIMAGFTILLGWIALRGMDRKLFTVVWTVALVALLAALNYHITDPLGLTGL